MVSCVLMARPEDQLSFSSSVTETQMLYVAYISFTSVVLLLLLVLYMCTVYHYQAFFFFFLVISI